MTASDDAIHIWTTLPITQWADGLAKLPQRTVIHGVTWPDYRQAVRHRLETGYRLRQTNVIWQGLDSRLLIAVPTDGVDNTENKLHHPHTKSTAT